MSSDFGIVGLFMPIAEVIAAFTVPHVELVADDGKQHGMCTEQQLPILNRVKAQIWRDLGRSTPVPARAVAVFGLEHRRDVVYYWSLASVARACIQAEGRRSRRRRTLPSASTKTPELPWCRG